MVRIEMKEQYLNGELTRDLRSVSRALNGRGWTVDWADKVVSPNWVLRVAARCGRVGAWRVNSSCVGGTDDIVPVSR